MDHQQIEQSGIVERYVQRQLAPDERLAFQEHYFACDECFEQVQSMARFVAGVQNASRTGLLSAKEERAGSSSWFGRFNPVFALSVALSLLLAAVALWLWLWKVPAYQQELVRERQTREESERNLATARSQADEAQRQLEIERAERAKLVEQLEQRKPGERPSPDLPGPDLPGPDLIAQANIPTVTLESTRDSQGTANQLTIPANTQSAIFRISVEPGNRISSFRVQIFSRTGALVQTVGNAKPSHPGILTISISSKNLQSGQYVVKVYGSAGSNTELLGEYDLSVVRK